jgi:hypothetical protein
MGLYLHVHVVVLTEHKDNFVCIAYKYYHMCECDCRRGFGLDIKFIDHFNTLIVSTLNYSPIADFYTSQITVTHTLVFCLLLDVSW